MKAILEFVEQELHLALIPGRAAVQADDDSATYGNTNTIQKLSDKRKIDWLLKHNMALRGRQMVPKMKRANGPTFVQDIFTFTTT